VILQPALAALHARTEETHELLAQLVQTNSHSANVTGVNAVGTLLRSALAALPLETSVTRDALGVEHLAFQTRATDHAQAVLLIGHHDTVFPPGEFETWSVADGVAHGPGVLDMKGGLALIVQVLRALHDVGRLAALPLCFVSVGDEEVGSPRSRALLEALVPHARSALVFEAGRARDAIITARRGSGQGVVTAHGRAAHAGNALAEGRNAIWALAKFIDAAQQLNGTIAGTSVNVGLIAGGTARNTVPDRARCELDLRFADAAGERALTEALVQLGAEAERALEGTRLALSLTTARKPWARSEESVALCARYAAAQQAAGLEACEAAQMGGGSDANTVGALGLAAIDGLGPRGSGFHTREERVQLGSLPKKAEALLRFLLSELDA
jgi:glutamate carboxypeptidase